MNTFSKTKTIKLECNTRFLELIKWGLEDLQDKVLGKTLCYDMVKSSLQCSHVI